MNIDKIHYISQAAADGSHLTAIENVLKAGCKWIQLRVKAQTEEVVMQLAAGAKILCEKYQARLIINDYPEIALRSGAFGVHLGLNDMPIAAARNILGNNYCIGGTANTFEDVLRRAEEGADYIGLGPFRFTATKKELSPILGIEGYTDLLYQVKQAGIYIPIIAIGGILIPDVASILKTGIYGVAVSGLLTNEAEPYTQFNLLKQEINLNLKEIADVNYSR